MKTSPTRLEIAEYILLVLVAIGTVVAAVQEQVVYLAVPLWLALGINLINRERHDRLVRRRTHNAIARLNQQLSETIDSLRNRLTAESTSQMQTPKPPPTPSPAPAGEAIEPELDKLRQEYASLEETISSVVRYLNSSALAERVSHLEETLPEHSAQQKNLASRLQVLETLLSEWPATTQESPSPRSPETTSTSGSNQETVSLQLPLPKPPTLHWDCIHSFAVHNDWVRAVTVNPEGTWLASGSFDSQIHIWRLPEAQLQHTLTGHQRGVFDVEILAGGILASGSWDETLKLWQLETGELLHTLTGHQGSVRDLSATPDGKILASGSFDETVKFWDVGTGELLHTLDELSGPIYAVAWNADGTALAIGRGDGLVKLWQLQLPRHDGTLYFTSLGTLRGNLDVVWSLAIAPNGPIMASGHGDGRVLLWSLDLGKNIQTLHYHAGAVYTVSFSQDGRFLVSGGADGTIQIWHRESNQVVSTLDARARSVLSLAMSADGRLLASGHADGTVKVWQMQNSGNHY
ncbi:WD40 repeat domain-containing protein [Geitlerinema sp. PCC 9228]|jgi:WD40 repeat protein|uniref:WD40 repeat domain-containing protein n=1 Tax=Geitlerinema sp. PCC 9228 TaxID=111611 RepID=UPI0008F9D53E|nr:WD40 repeat domain-containing protein [Geitlerinema sp. PCC 9228]